MIGPHELSSSRIDGTKKKLRLPIEGTSAVDLCYSRLWRGKMGHNSMGGIGLLIPGIEVQQTFPKKPSGGRVINAEHEGRKSVGSRSDSSRKDPLLRLASRKPCVLTHVQFI